MTERALTTLGLLVAILITVSLLPPFCSAQVHQAELDSVLAALHADGLFDGAIAISEDGQVVYRAAYGTRSGDPITPMTAMYIASVSKAMNASAVLSLVAEGRIELDDPVGRHLQPWPYPEITVRHLLNQTSGLHFLTTLTAHADTTQRVTTADLLQLLDQHRPEPAFAAGTQFDYDNANYAVLGALLETVDGRPYARVLRDRVFEPAGMDDAYVDQSGESGWIGWSGGDGAAVHASVEDLLAFDYAFRTGRIVPEHLVRAAETPPSLPDGAETRYGFGRFLTDDPRPLIGHFGEGTAAKSGLYRERKTGTTFAILMPGDGIHRTAVLTAAMAIWNGEEYELPERRPVASVPERVLARYVGIYESGMGRLHITLEGGGLHLEPEGAGGSEPLIPASETAFYFGHQDLTWEFVLDEEGSVVGLMLQDHPETMGKKVE